MSGGFPGSAPIDEGYRAIARQLDLCFNGSGAAKRIGFCLFVFEFGKIDAGRVNYISNANRADMIVAVKEWLARAEGRVPTTPETPQ